ncbi:Transcriptional regulator, SARP family OS=Tsukamurella paurometabola (strain ATCC 8368 / DSM/ CCUG 35730 / CIP 100753 / JCM 10117 / KCTC 9821 / NBRC 16120/ NCIMB 702349 / NCTC 13040) OX=521096 GN=Tpau_0709 PE=3 SV=1 [Tsukamurella paurometabola]|uniref:Transcriptional regulator, SARP family n=1 Tax=Tsukamurella paurometabola (strain ATCC 8368 / DSM 20162 / CCUG 35730 / CIP 100753 / JCM 10117 / KCTC 9821 / NBRC 16120 / NCIMB 702349 / NCTC 13040) TaxID=521096 RepID=D5UT59_TSUPD|nr:BTAD domain-containing putative transcriptional regulator [Tsukamurella paurometabola]ADG77346.1 transcriptional regulator, SARP family [Tsukamurella paurometabola DSM 20162]SUP26562.1 Probable regulatory protein embR [Tsukamurella paurometabola]
MASLDIRVLGQVSLSVDGAPNEVSGVKPRSVLALLVMNRGRAVTVDSLSEQVWDGNPPASARASLQVFVSGLRKALRGPGAGSGLDALLVTSGSTYRLDLEPDQSDVGRFDAARRRGAELAAAGRFDQASLMFASALAEFRGDAVADLRGLQFADNFAIGMAEERAAVQSAMYDAEIAAGRAGSVIGDLRRLVSEHPLQEPLWGQLITALYVTGRQADALEAARELRRTLADELGADPTPALVELEGKVLRQEQLAFAQVRPAQPGTGRAFEKTETDAAADSSGPRGLLIASDGTEYPVHGEIRLGRLPDNDVSVDDTKVSREHAVITGAVSGFAVRDLMSSNGTFVGERRVAGQMPLSDGDELTLGRTTFTFRVIDED